MGINFLAETDEETKEKGLLRTTWNSILTARKGGFCINLLSGRILRKMLLVEVGI